MDNIINSVLKEKNFQIDKLNLIQLEQKIKVKVLHLMIELLIIFNK